MAGMPANPFERFDLQVGATLAELTASLRERIEDAETEEERHELRELWEALTRNLGERAALVLGAMPNLAHELPAAQAAPTFEADAPRAIDVRALPAFPLEWDTLLEAVVAGPPASVDLADDTVLQPLDAVTLP